MTRTAITTVKTVVAAIEAGGDGIKVFSLIDPDGWELPPFRPGGHIDLHLPGGVVRTYSLCNDPGEGTRYVIAVKRENAGRGGSILLHDSIKIGDTIGVSLPRGGIALPGEVKRVVLVAGGIGVTPFLSVAAQLRRTGHHDVRIHLVVRERIPLEEKLAPFMRAGAVVLHRTSTDGRPDMAALVGAPSPELMAGCCGPETMIDDFERATAAWAPSRVHVERFVPPPLPLDATAKPYVLDLKQSRRAVAVAPGQSMLAALQDAGVEISSSCNGGLCGACKVGFLDGSPVHRDRVLSPYERERYLMACVAGCASERLVLDL